MTGWRVPFGPFRQYPPPEPGPDVPLVRIYCPQCGERLEDALSQAPWCWSTLLESVTSTT